MIVNHPLEFKASDVGADGSFTGYGARFSNVDLGGDVIEPGAFKEIVRNRNGKVAVLLQHSTRDVIGEAAVSQDGKGLAVTGRLLLEDPLAKKAHRLVRAGLVTGLSIGYDTLRGGAQILENGIRKLTDLKLWEISVVTFGANPLAQVESIKALSAAESVHELKTILHHEHQFSRSKAATAADALWRILQARDDPASETQEQLFEQLKTFQLTLKGN